MSVFDHKGLTPAEVEASRARYGDNLLTPPARESILRLYLTKFDDPIIRILLVAAALSLGVSFFEGHFAETIGIIAAILLSTGISFWFEYDARRRFDSLNCATDRRPVKVIRSGSVHQITRAEVVVGDLVLLEAGEEVPADGQLLEATSLRLDESTLTGEPSADKTTDPAHFDREATYPSDRVLRSTTVIEGHGLMRVDAVGDRTEFGQVAQQAAARSEEKSPLTLQLERLSKLIGIAGSILAVVIFCVMLARGFFWGGPLAGADWLTIVRALLEYFMISVAIMVMAVPEGLPMSITLSLALSMRKMLKTNNLVRRMHACETMGAVTVICTDKTGTLTRNRMSVEHMIRCPGTDPALVDELAATCSTAFLDEEGRVIGNPTEGALLLWLAARGVDYAGLRGAAREVDQLPFSTERKFMAVLVDSAVTGRRMLYVKGAPEVVRGLCTVPDETGADPYSDDGTTQVAGGVQLDSMLADFQSRALRTLALAAAPVDAPDVETALASAPLRMTGAAAILDPVRDEVPEAVADCLRAGIDVKIVTGDTPATAREIARRIGLWNDARDGVPDPATGLGRGELTGTQFAAMSDEQLLERLPDLRIMARARPLDKQRLVQLLQRAGEVVAVTGDGTNDAPALNFAHVGLSMGSGTTVAKEASDITLLDDSFRSIATAVLWGRSLYKNIQRFVLFQLTINVAAILIFFFGSIFSGHTPLTVTQILWVNLIMDTFAALALASLPPDRRVMNERPRSRNAFIITRTMMRQIVGTGTLIALVLLSLLWLWDRTGGADLYRLSAFFTVFVLMQFWNLFNAKALGTHSSAFAGLGRQKVFLGVAVLILIGQVVIVTIGDGVFRTTPLILADWLTIVAATSAILWGGELLRLAGRIRRR